MNRRDPVLWCRAPARWKHWGWAVLGGGGDAQAPLQGRKAFLLPLLWHSLCMASVLLEDHGSLFALL